MKTTSHDGRYSDLSWKLMALSVVLTMASVMNLIIMIIMFISIF